MRIQKSLIALLSLALASAATAQMTSLHVGDQAPGLDVEKWIKGEETALDEGTVYIVEFWATWCAPCRKSIPHLTEIQNEYEDQGLRVIGVSTEDPKVVANFVRAQGSKMDYTVVVDKFNATERTWQNAAGAQGIPNAFIVDRNGRIQYIGHPLAEEFDTIVGLVVRGRYDARLMEKAKPHLKAAETARKVKNWQLATTHLLDIYKLDQHVFAELLLEQFEMMIVDQQDPAGAYMLARKMMEERGPQDPELMCWLARKIVNDPKIQPKDRNIDVAMEAAKIALQFARPDDPMPRSTMATVHFARGETDKAVALQTEAWMIAPPKQKAEYKRTLDSYQQAAARTASRASSN